MTDLHPPPGRCRDGEVAGGANSFSADSALCEMRRLCWIGPAALGGADTPETPPIRIANVPGRLAVLVPLFEIYAVQQIVSA